MARKKVEETASEMEKGKCKLCHDTGYVVRTFTGGCGLETPWRPKGSSGSREDETRQCSCQRVAEMEKASEIQADYLSHEKTLYQIQQEEIQKLKDIIDRQATKLEAKDAALAKMKKCTCPRSWPREVHHEDMCQISIVKQALKGDKVNGTQES